MAAEDSEPTLVENAVNSVTERLHDLPASEGVNDGSINPPARFRLFNRQRPLHQVLGGGTPADVILWRKKYMSAGILVGSTIGWILLEKSGFTLLTIVSNVLLLLIVGLFVWANAAAFIHKPPPRIPELHLTEDMVINFASALRVEINKALAIAHDIALGKDLKVFLKVVAVLWGLSIVGGWFHVLTLIYICVMLSHTIPVIYERYEDKIDSYTKIAMDEAQKRYRTLNDVVSKKIPKAGSKEKKAQ
eukprot:c16151_g1_i1 orf=227-967(+)